MINYNSPSLGWDLADMDKMQLIGEIMRLHKELTDLRNFRDDAFIAYPNIDLDIEYRKRNKVVKEQSKVCVCKTNPFSISIQRTNKSENCASGAMARWTECKCEKCGREWEET